MTVDEAVEHTQGRKAGFVNRLSAQYAQTLLMPKESVIAAVIANIATRKERFPGVAVLTDCRIMAVCGLPGIRRSVICDLGRLEKCVEKPAAITYSASFAEGENAFSMTVDPDTGEKFSRYLAAMNGLEDEFDAVGYGADNGIWNPTLIRNKRRANLAKERRKNERTVKEPAGNRDNIQGIARRLKNELDEAKKQGDVSDSDPRAIAARLASELAAQQGGNANEPLTRSENKEDFT